MPKYVLTADSFINNTLQKAGTEVEYDGEPGPNLQPVGKAAEAIVAALKTTPKAVSDLLAKIRLHAATRGVPPSEANEDDVNEVLTVMPNKPSAETLASVRAALTSGEAVDLS